MTLFNDSKSQVVESLEVALFFADSANVERLFPFMQAELSMTEAAEHLGLSKSLMSYWVNRMRDLGLLERMRVEKRGRHKVPIYRAIAQSFYVSLELLPFEAGQKLREEMLRHIQQPLEAALNRLVAPHPQAWHIHCYVQEGQEFLSVKPNQGGLEDQPFVHQLGRVQLSEARAEAFRLELRALLKRYSRDDLQGKSYLYQLALVAEH